MDDVSKVKPAYLLESSKKRAYIAQKLGEGILRSHNRFLGLTGSESCKEKCFFRNQEVKGCKTKINYGCDILFNLLGVRVEEFVIHTDHIPLECKQFCPTIKQEIVPKLELFSFNCFI